MALMMMMTNGHLVCNLLKSLLVFGQCISDMKNCIVIIQIIIIIIIIVIIIITIVAIILIIVIIVKIIVSIVLYSLPGCFLKSHDH